MAAQEIKNLIKGEALSDNTELKFYSRDASIFEIIPEIVVKPQDTDDLKQLIRFVSEKKKDDPKLSLTARSAGTDMSGGPLNTSIILDFTAHFNRIVEIGGSYAIVEPGVYYRDFEKETLKKNLFLPSYPASKDWCTLGGMVANNAGGEKSLSYGKTEDYIEELSAVLADGEEYLFGPLTPNELEAKKQLTTFEGKIYREIYELVGQNYNLLQKAKPRVHKNSAGYYLWNVWDRKRFDLTKILVGSQGTLGLITKIKFRLIKPKKYSKLLVIFLKTLDPLADLVKTVLEAKPESFESSDDNTFKLALKFFPEIIKRMKGSALKLFFNFLPEFFMLVTGGIPKLVLIAEFTDDSEEIVLERVKKIRSIVREKFGVKTYIASSMSQMQKYWTVRRESFNLLRQHAKGLRTAPFIDDIIVPPESMPEFLPKLNQILEPHKELIYTIAGHSGEGNFHIIPLMDIKNPKERELIPQLSEEVYDLVLKYGGSITAEHNDGIIRTPYLKKMYGEEVYSLFEKTKQIFDPQNIFNPGKKVHGTTEDIMKYMIK